MGAPARRAQCHGRGGRAAAGGLGQDQGGDRSRLRRQQESAAVDGSCAGRLPPAADAQRRRLGDADIAKPTWRSNSAAQPATLSSSGELSEAPEPSGRPKPASHCAESDAEPPAATLPADQPSPTAAAAQDRAQRRRHLSGAPRRGAGGSSTLVGGRACRRARGFHWVSLVAPGAAAAAAVPFPDLCAMARPPKPRRRLQAPARQPARRRAAAGADRAGLPAHDRSAEPDTDRAPGRGRPPKPATATSCG